jgi:hypothetical protein
MLFQLSSGTVRRFSVLQLTSIQEEAKLSSWPPTSGQILAAFRSTTRVLNHMYEDKFVAFVDILGFSDLVKRSEAGGPDAPTVDDILNLTKQLGDTTSRARFAERGPAVCPNAPYISRDLGYRVTQISDCVVASAEVSPAGVINLLFHAASIQINLLPQGHLCRGYVTRGNIFHTDTQFFGTGHMRAFDGEKRVSIFQTDAADHGTPFIELDPQLCQYVLTQPDTCVKMLFERMTESDGQTAALSPFPALKRVPASVIRDDFDPAYWKKQVQVSRTNRLRSIAQLEKMEAVASERGRAKIQHYKRKLLEVLATKDIDDALLDQLSLTYPKSSTTRRS